MMGALPLDRLWLPEWFRNKWILKNKGQDITMCLAVPMKIIDIKPGFKGLVELDGSRRVVDLSLLDDAKPGDYVIVHAGFAIETLDQKEADATLDLFNELVKGEEDRIWEAEGKQ